MMAIVREVDMDIDGKIIKEAVRKLNGLKILVIGDLALDEMVYGDTERISREAPVLILNHTYTKYILGGASNAAHNVSALDCGKVSVIGRVGDDYQAQDLRKAFEEEGIDIRGIITDTERKTITKTRVEETKVSKTTCHETWKLKELQVTTAADLSYLWYQNELFSE